MKRKSIFVLVGLFIMMIASMFTPTKTIHAEGKSVSSEVSVRLSEVEVFLNKVALHFCFESNIDDVSFGTEKDGYVITVKTNKGEYNIIKNKYDLKKGESHYHVTADIDGKIESIIFTPVVYYGQDEQYSKIETVEYVNIGDYKLSNRVPVVIVDSALFVVYIAFIIGFYNISRHPLKHNGKVLICMGANISLFSIGEFIIRPIVFAKYHIQFQMWGILPIVCGIIIALSGVVCLLAYHKKSNRVIEEKPAEYRLDVMDNYYDDTEKYLQAIDELEKNKK